MSQKVTMGTQESTHRIGVVGGGISGIAAAWLLSQRYSVTLIEKESRIGGHAHTHVLDSGPDAGTPIDMGFIVLNDRNYPTLMRLFDQWGVPVQDSDMSFGFEDKASGFFYSSDVPWGLFARRRNLISPVFWRFLGDHFRFQRISRRHLQEGPSNMTLGQFLEKHRFSNAYINFHILPVSAAVWSTPQEEIVDFPVDSILHFYNHHGLLSQRSRPQWKTVVDGSISYVQAFEKLFRGKIKKACPVLKVQRVEDSVRVTMKDRSEMLFDAVVLATHADVTKRLLVNPEPEEHRVFSKWNYTKNHVCLNFDAQVMPPKKKAWASWQYIRMLPTSSVPSMTMSYYMNRLQKLSTSKDYFVTLNGDTLVDDGKRIDSLVFEHPCYTFDSLSTHSELENISGKNRIYFCGAYCGYGFHEDGARSGLAVANKLGVDL